VLALSFSAWHSRVWASRPLSVESVMLYDVFLMTRRETLASVVIAPVLVRRISAHDEREALKKAKEDYQTSVQLAVQETHSESMYA
jgi:hypothetical protein